MQDLNERVRRFITLMADRSGRAMQYWDQIPPIRLGQEFLNRAEKLVEALTTGKGNVTEVALDLAFVCFLFSEKGPELREAMERVYKSPAVETTVEEEDPEREEWERKRAEKKGGYDWQG